MMSTVLKGLSLSSFLNQTPYSASIPRTAVRSQENPRFPSGLSSPAASCNAEVHFQL